MEAFMEATRMAEKMRIMTENPLNAETRPEFLRSWITANSVFFDRNQSAVMEEPVNLADWRLTVEGEVKEGLHLSFEEILRMPKAMVSNTLECSGNSRSLLKEKAKGNPWTIGGVGNAVWSGVWLRDVLEKAGLKTGAKHVAFEGLDKSMGSKGIKFIRSIPIEKAMTSTLLAYEMNGEPLPLKHGFPLRGLALGWTGANCVKWLQKISLLERPFEGFFMDTVYRIYQKGQDPKSGQVVRSLAVKSIITQPLQGEKLPSGPVTILGAAYAGESGIERVEVSLDGGKTWEAAEFIGPREPYAWRQWQYVLKAPRRGGYTVFSRATDSEGRKQPANAHWNVLGYGNNGIEEHAVTFQVT
jgi:DMSO/TMAO reductase YedYZ molybdopterin-dependent catalytic subunit